MESQTIKFEYTLGYTLGKVHIYANGDVSANLYRKNTDMFCNLDISDKRSRSNIPTGFYSSYQEIIGWVKDFLLFTRGQHIPHNKDLYLGWNTIRIYPRNSLSTVVCGGYIYHKDRMVEEEDFCFDNPVEFGVEDIDSEKGVDAKKYVDILEGFLENLVIVGRNFFAKEWSEIQ